jgi:hypothetical protein
MNGNGFRAWVARVQAGPAYISVPVGVLFVIGGLLSFLPVLQVWMLPLGLWILSPHVPFARRLTRRMLKWSIRNGFVRIKRVERNDAQDREPPSGA